MKIAFLSTHPIQYQAPLYQVLAEHNGIDLTVYFCYKPTPIEQGAGFGVAFEWDVDLLSGYHHVFLNNVSLHPARGFLGYDTPEIEDIIHRECYDWFIVQGWNNKSYRQAFRACRRTGTKLGVRSDSNISGGYIGVTQGIKEIVKRLIYPYFIRRFDLCLPYGSLSAEYFRRFGAKRIVISPHFVNNDLFSRSAAIWTPRRDDIRRHWNIPADAVCFLFCGKFQQKKHPLEILKALRHTLTSIMAVNPVDMHPPPIHLLMVGDGELRRTCEQYVRTHSLPVTFAGFLNQGEIAKSYVAGDCLVLASDAYETWGLVVNEAMACGLPAIVSNACGCAPDLLIEGMTGYTFPYGDIDALADRMDRMVVDQEARLRMSNGAQRHIDAFSVGRAADILIEAIQERNIGKQHV